MTIKNNGQRRNPKDLLSSGFLLVLAIISMYLTFRDNFRWSWLLISLALFYLSFAMFRNSNEA